MPSIRRALNFPNYVFYGAFDPVAPTKFPGWVFEIRSNLSKRSWIVAVIVDTNKLQHFARILDRIPYEYYVGGNSKMYEGDVPILCMEERKKLK